MRTSKIKSNNIIADIIADINQNNIYMNGTHIINNMTNDLQNIQVRFQEMIAQSIYMLETLIEMEKEKNFVKQ